jgi:F-type H+-transporting ATPase subunit a
VIQLTVQSDVYVIILITILLGAAMILISKKIDQADPLEKPKGILVPVLWGVEIVYNMVKTNVGDRYADRLTPYIITLWVYIFVSNIISLFGFSSPTANLSVTLLLAFITWVLIQITELKFQGIGGYLHSFLEPIPVMLPMNIFGKFSTMVSMSLRLFGNVLSGTIMLGLWYALMPWFAKVGVPAFLHAYFDLFSGAIQTYVFGMLTMTFVTDKYPD